MSNTHNNRWQYESGRFFTWIRRSGLMRGGDRWVGGVCSGLASRYGVSPSFVRAVVGASSLVFGFGLAFYAVAWVLLPDVEDGRILGEDTIHGEWSWTLIGPIILLIMASWMPGLGLLIFLTAVIVLCIMVNTLVHQAREGDNAPYRGNSSNASPPAADASFGSSTSAQYGDWRDGAAMNGNASAGVRSEPERNGMRGGTGQPYQQGNGQWNQSGSAAGDQGTPYMPQGGAATAPFGTTYVSTPVSAPPRKRKPKRLRRRPAGAVVTLLSFGLVFLIAAAACGSILFGNAYFSGVLQVIGVAVAVMCLVVGIVIVTLGARGRRAGGMNVLAVLVVCAAVLTSAFYGTLVAEGYESLPYKRSYNSESVDGFVHHSVTQDKMQRLNNGVSYYGTDYDSSVLNLDLSEYAKTAGTHKMTQENGETVDSGCPAGRINLTAYNAQIVVTLPRGCSFMLTNVREGLVGIYNRQDGKQAHLISEHDGSRKVEVYSKDDHRDLGGFECGVTPDADTDDSDGINLECKDSDGYYYFGSVDADKHISMYGRTGRGYWYDGMPLNTLIPGARTLGSPYGMMTSDGFNMQLHMSQQSDNRPLPKESEYQWMSENGTMPQNGPELIISASELVQAQVRVLYPDQADQQ